MQKERKRWLLAPNETVREARQAPLANQSKAVEEALPAPNSPHQFDVVVVVVVVEEGEDGTMHRLPSTTPKRTAAVADNGGERASKCSICRHTDSQALSPSR